ncbi:RNA-directed DNA polymerase, eukaryota [Tanacetum coccineum]
MLGGGGGGTRSSPNRTTDKDSSNEDGSEDEFNGAANEEPGSKHDGFDDFVTSDIPANEPSNEYVSETHDIQNLESLEDKENQVPLKENSLSGDPFNIYPLLRKKGNNNINTKDSDPTFPPGFTPVSVHLSNDEGSASVNNNQLSSSGKKSDSNFNAVPSGLGHKAKKGWINELCSKHKINFLALQETKMEYVDLFTIKRCWGNLSFDHAVSSSVGNSGGIICVWDSHMFVKDHVSTSDYFLAIFGTWTPTASKLLVISVYAPQDMSEKRDLWVYLSSMINRWDGETVVMGDFNEVRTEHERCGSLFNSLGANAFNNFISSAGLIDIPLGGYSFTWTHKSASKMSKLDRFLVTEGLLINFPNLLGFDSFVTEKWKGLNVMDSNAIARFKKKLQLLKIEIKTWVKMKKDQISYAKSSITARLVELDSIIDHGNRDAEILTKRTSLSKELIEVLQKAIDIRWIAGCLNSAKGSVLVNRSPTLEFKFHRGLKQGDPLSPFLFILVMESLHRSFSRVLEDGLYKGIYINNSLLLSHLFYADDAVFVGEWNRTNIITIVRVLKCFYMASGLKINLSKSKLSGIGVSKREVDEAAAIVGCSTLSFPFQYLGVKIGAPMSRIKSWNEVIEKVSSRLSKWKIQTLSSGGRLTLIKSVLNALPLYYMSLFKAPKAVLKALESLRSNFFNGASKEDRKMVLVRWDKIMASKSKGGLGVSSLFASNRGKDDITNFNPKISGFYFAGFGFREFLALKDKVAEKLNLVSLDTSFRRKPRGGIEDEQFRSLALLSSHVLLPNSPDRWYWSLDGSGNFTVNSVRSYIDDMLLPKSDTPTRWVKLIPIKINILAWKISLDCLPTRFILSSRGLEIDSLLCPVCNASAEISSHSFFACSLARNIMRNICYWWELDVVSLNSYSDWIIWLNSIRLNKNKKEILEGICLVSWWFIWYFRNQIIFGKVLPKKDLLFDNIVQSSFFWISNRCKDNIDWVSWLKNPNLLPL